MLFILYYCLKVIVCSGLLFGYYLLVLRNNRFHQWNRFYLLATILIAFALPFVKVQLPFFSADEEPVVIQSFRIVSAPDIYFAKLRQNYFEFTWQKLLSTFYICTVLFLVILFIKSLVKVTKLKKIYSSENLNGIHFYNTTEPGTPFSFFKHIFWDSNISLSSEKGQQVFRHEMTHVTENHSVDKVAIELLIAVAWWNPFLYFIRKELAIIHEFIADQKASAGNAKLQYASLLLMKAIGSEQYALGNPFFHSQLKRRLIMLTTSKNPKFSYVRRLLVLPLTVLALILFSFKYKQEKNTKQEANKTPRVDNAIPDAAIETPINVHGFYEDTTKKKPVVIKKEYKGSAIVSTTLTDDNKGVVVKTKNGKTYFLDRSQANEELGMKLSDNSFIGIQIDKNGVPADNYNNEEYRAGQRITPAQPQPLYIIDGKEASEEEKKKLDPNSIESINVLKGKSAKDMYGEKGNNGVIEVRTKKSDFPEDALYIINDKEISKETVEKLLKENGVERMDVWKGDDAIKVFGDKGKNGVVIIAPKFAKNEVTMPESGQTDRLKEVTVVGYQKKPEFDAVFTKAEEPASFPGGIDGWRRYLERNLQYPAAAQEKGTQGTVRVQLTVHPDGNLTDIKALNDPGNGLAEEAVRVIQKGPKWIPAKQNGKVVTYRFVQTINFQLQ
jgi:TonB family protein